MRNTPLAVLLLCSACSGTSRAPRSSVDAVSPSAPLIVVDARDIRLDGERVTDAGSLEHGGVSTVPPLFQAVARVSGSAGAGPVDLRFDLRDAGPFAGVAALRTAAAAVGHASPRLQLWTPSGGFLGRWDAAGHEADSHRRLLVQVVGDQVFLAFQSDAACDDVPESPTPVALADLDGYLARITRGRTPIDAVYLTLGEGTGFARGLAALDVVARYATPEPALAIFALSRRAAPPQRTCGRPVPRVGILPQQAVQEVIRSHAGAMRACYEQGLLRNAGLQGKVTPKFVIEPDGHVSSVRLEPSADALPDSTVTDCIRAVVGKCVFPRPENRGAVTVVYPFNFAIEAAGPKKP